MVIEVNEMDYGLKEIRLSMSNEAVNVITGI